MQALALLSPRGRLQPGPFLIAVAIIYVAGATSHWLTVPDVIARAGLWPFAAVQTVLTWLWFVLHARRLHDAARGHGLATAVALGPRALLLRIVDRGGRPEALGQGGAESHRERGHVLEDVLLAGFLVSHR